MRNVKTSRQIRDKSELYQTICPYPFILMPPEEAFYYKFIYCS